MDMNTSAFDKLHCVFIRTSGEILEAADTLKALGYETDLYPSTQEISSLRDIVPKEILDYFSPSWPDSDTPQMQSLRSSFSRMLLDPRFMEDDLIIFGESDAAAITSAAELRPLLEKELREHPETDIFRLFHHEATTSPDFSFDSNSPSFEKFLTASRSKASRYVRGSYAMIIPADKRQKVTNLFLDCNYAIDRAIEWASAEGQLNVRVATYNHFYQQPRTQHYDRTVSYAWRQKKIAVCLPVYGLENMERLVTWGLAEQYPNLHFFVALKNITEPLFQRIVEPRWRPMVKSGFLTLRLFPGKNPGSDILDTVRDLNTNDYEYFLILKETEMPPLGFFKILNDFLSLIPQYYSAYYRGNICSQSSSGASFWKDLSSSATCFSLTQKTFSALQDREKKSPPYSCGDFANYLLSCLIAESGCKNIFPFLNKESGQSAPFCNLSSNTSRIPDSLSKARIAIQKNFTDNPEFYEHALEIKHSCWHDLFRIIGKEGWREKTGDHASVLKYNGQELLIKWDKWGKEYFGRSEDGYFRLIQEQEKEEEKTYTTPINQKNTPKQTSPIHAQHSTDKKLRWGVCTVGILRESYYWLRDWIDFHLRAGASLVVIYDNTGSTGSLDVYSNSKFKNGHFQKQRVSKRGEEYGRLTNHLTDEKILEEAHELAASYGDNIVRIVPWQPRDPKTGRIIHGQIESYEDFIYKMGHELDWCAFIDFDEYLYCAPGKSIESILEQTERETPDAGRFLMKAWRFPIRWGKDGPLDISSFREHLPVRDEAKKNLVRLRDSEHASIHWDWKMKAGIRTLHPHPEELAFCHYNVTPSEFIDRQSLIDPRGFLLEQTQNNIN